MELRRLIWAAAGEQTGPPRDRLTWLAALGRNGFGRRRATERRPPVWRNRRSEGGVARPARLRPSRRSCRSVATAAVWRLPRRLHMSNPGSGRASRCVRLWTPLRESQRGAADGWRPTRSSPFTGNTPPLGGRGGAGNGCHACSARFCNMRCAQADADGPARWSDAGTWRGSRV